MDNDNTPQEFAGRGECLNFRGETLEQAREQLVNALKSTKSWLTGYAEAYVDDFLDMAAKAPAKCEVCHLPQAVAGVAGHPMKHCACARLVLRAPAVEATRTWVSPGTAEASPEVDEAVERACLGQFGPEWARVSKHGNSHILSDSVRRGVIASQVLQQPDAEIDDQTVERACHAQFGAAWDGPRNCHNSRILADSVRQGLVAARGTRQSDSVAVNETSDG